MKNKLLNVTISGACGKIAFELLPLLCNGLVFGQDTKISLNLYDLPKTEKKLEGIQMEIEDCALPLVHTVKTSTYSRDAFVNCDVGILIASYPHKEGMERKELIAKNNEIFQDIGENLNNHASKNCKVIVVANPVNSLLTLLAHHANNIPTKNFTGLSRLDYNRAKFLLAKTYDTTTDKIKKLIVWGNHSDTQFPDVFHSTVEGKRIQDLSEFDHNWLHTSYIETIVNRWKKIVQSTGSTSVLGPANATKDHLRDWYHKTEPDDFVPMAVIADGKTYNVPKGVGFSFPCVTENFEYRIVDNIVLDQFTEQKIKLSYEEIKNELKLIGFHI